MLNINFVSFFILNFRRASYKYHVQNSLCKTSPLSGKVSSIEVLLPRKTRLPGSYWVWLKYEFFVKMATNMVYCHCSTGVMKKVQYFQCNVASFCFGWLLCVRLVLLAKRHTCAAQLPVFKNARTITSSCSMRTKKGSQVEACCEQAKVWHGG